MYPKRRNDMKLLICGSRKITKFDLAPYVPDEVELIITGGAKGIDTIAEEYAASRGIPALIVRPEYSRYGSKAAPVIRNKQMVDMADAVLAVWDGVSAGTKATMDYAESVGKNLTVIK